MPELLEREEGEDRRSPEKDRLEKRERITVWLSHVGI